MGDETVTHAQAGLSGEIRLPTDKSISHRAVLLAAMAEGESFLIGVLDSADVRSTIAACEALGASIETVHADERGLQVKVTGWGNAGPAQPSGPIDCGNSGTTVRLLAGVLAGWPVDVTLTGDESLSARPMERIAAPLREMGATVTTSAEGTLPMRVRGGELTAISYDSPVASAQVKSAVLLAGLRATGATTVTEPRASRDHTERMAPAFGAQVAREGLSASVNGPATLTGTQVIVPADPSSAAFSIAAATLLPGSKVLLPNVSLNPTRIGFIGVLREMGANITLKDLPPMGNETVGTIVVQSAAELHGVTVGADVVPTLIDEVPVLALVASQAAGATRFEGVGELRVKESDRIEAVRAGLTALGARVTAGDDWLEVTGPSTLTGATLTSGGDHRLAMTWAVAGLIAEGDTTIEDFDAVGVSYPRFLEDLLGLVRGDAEV
ncbi:3-phosphoshikimate 1-carboxyvinyltransferase [Anaerosoma tenue]|uniref:3-phosphoshikimate 1-carboxyvinyltransferase n=1 Tax=Anaerosoma tenue TaxID=2933588 RepID=UPI002260B11C|nr:3-phosphoshikimate 1-carboxyvinyltransferase [Anaerosoma tenue]MCK8114123.1 3-phosphoshikimate 1-carboxyvinyltransferase [Anaerosoma tenue]